MHRRQYLVTVSAVAAFGLAGCGGADENGSTDSSGTGTATNTPSEADTRTETTTTTATTSSATSVTSDIVTDTETAPTAATTHRAQPTTRVSTDSATTASPAKTTQTGEDERSVAASESSQLTVTEADLSVSTEGDIPAASTGGLVENSGSLIGKVTATATIYNSSGDAITTESSTLAALPSGKQWTVFVPIIGDGAGEAEDSDLTVHYNPHPPEFTTDGLKILSSEFAPSDGEATVTGEVKNTTPSPLKQLTATVFLYLNEEKTQILATLQDSTESLASGQTWGYKVSTNGAENVVGQKTRYTYG